MIIIYSMITTIISLYSFRPGTVRSVVEIEPVVLKYIPGKHVLLDDQFHQHDDDDDDDVDENDFFVMVFDYHVDEILNRQKHIYILLRMQNDWITFMTIVRIG